MDKIPPLLKGPGTPVIKYVFGLPRLRLPRRRRLGVARGSARGAQAAADGAAEENGGTCRELEKVFNLMCLPAL